MLWVRCSAVAVVRSTTATTGLQEERESENSPDCPSSSSPGQLTPHTKHPSRHSYARLINPIEQRPTLHIVLIIRLSAWRRVLLFKHFPLKTNLVGSKFQILRGPTISLKIHYKNKVTGDDELRVNYQLTWNNIDYTPLTSVISAIGT